jgi:putative DNA primase/helicase
MSAYDQLRGPGKGGNGKNPPSAKLQSVRASSVRMTAVDWIWPDRFAFRKLGLLVGLPDEGKGQVLSYIAARVTSADDRTWPCNEGFAPLGNVILLTAEDDLDDTVVPRLVAAGADLNRIEIVRMVQDEGERMFNLVSDLELLRQKIVEVGDVVLVLIDPISAYLGIRQMDSYRTSDVRAVLAPLVNLADEKKVGIVGVMHFNKKVDITNVMLRISDSLAYGATARHVYGVINDPENKRKLLVRGKNNLASNATCDKALAYHFGVQEVGTDNRNNKTIVAPYVIWEPKYVDVTATEAMQAASDNKSPAARDEAKKFLQDLLGADPVAVKDIEDAAEGNGIGWRTVERAKRDLKVVAKKGGMSKGWTWELPEGPRPYWADVRDMEPAPKTTPESKASTEGCQRESWRPSGGVAAFEESQIKKKDKDLDIGVSANTPEDRHLSLPGTLHGDDTKTAILPATAKVLGLAPGQRCELCGSGKDVFLIRRRRGGEAAPLHKACAARAWSNQ